MPLCHIASLPLVNSAVSKSGVPPISATVGIIVPGLPISHSAASTPSGELNVGLAVGVEERAAGLGQRLVELEEADTGWKSPYTPAAVSVSFSAAACSSAHVQSAVG